MENTFTVRKFYWYRLLNFLLLVSFSITYVALHRSNKNCIDILLYVRNFVLQIYNLFNHDFGLNIKECHLVFFFNFVHMKRTMPSCR